MNRPRRIVYAVIAALAVGVGLPMVDVAVKCERSRARTLAVCPTPDSVGPCPVTSEACVWGKSLLPLSIGASLLLLGIPAALLVYWWAGRGRRAHA